MENPLFLHLNRCINKLSFADFKKILFFIVCLGILTGCSDDVYSCDNKDGQVSAMALLTRMPYDNPALPVLIQRLEDVATREVQTTKFDKKNKSSYCKLSYYIKDKEGAGYKASLTVKLFIIASMFPPERVIEDLDNHDNMVKQELEKDRTYILNMDKMLKGKSIFTINYKIFDNGKGESMIEVY